jgi:hypothetical protein
MLSRKDGPTFQAALDAYDESRIKATKENKWRGSRNSADTEHLERWKKNDFVEKLWKSIQGAARPDTPILPAEFIETVLKARRSAQACVNRMYGTKGIKGNFAKFGPDGGIVHFKRELSLGFKRKWAAALPDLKKTLSKKLSQSPASIGPLKVATILEQAAKEVRGLHRFHFGFADQTEMSREDKKGSRVRNLFMQTIHDYLHLHCGRYLDDEVADLAEIAFDCQLTLNQAVWARRTQRARETRSKK